MKITKLSNYTGGWVVGNFDPSLLRTDQFEVAVKKYAKGESDETHVHKVATEITIITQGRFLMNDTIITEGDVVFLEPGEVSSFSCLEDGYITVIKTPSIEGDKYII